MKEREQKEQHPKVAPFTKGETTPALGDSGTPFTKGDLPNFNAWQLAWELGYTIAIPIVIFALLGRWGDKEWGTSPWLLLFGILLSIIVSSIIVYRRVSKILH